MKKPQKAEQKIPVEDYDKAKKLHRKLVAQVKLLSPYRDREDYNRLHADIHALMGLINTYEEVDMYNKYARNVCPFAISPECKGVFTNYLGHYVYNGNCCHDCCSELYNIMLKKY